MHDKEIKEKIVTKLYRHDYFGGKHTDIENLKKGMPRHIGHEIKQQIKELVKENIILLKPTAYGLHVSLNPEKRKEIEKYIN